MEIKSEVRKRIFTIAIAVIALVGIATSGFLFVQYQNAQKLLNNPTIQGQLEAKDLVKKISQIMLLPSDEQPTVATVSDVKKLADQQFFKNAKNGDKVLIYTNAKMAILYDPKVNKIIAVAPVNLGQQVQSPIRIELYNGTSISGLTNTVEQELRAKVSNMVVVGRDNAKDSYTKTLVVDLTGSHKQDAANLAALLGGTVGSLPTGEVAPANADLLVIVGK